MSQYSNYHVKTQNFTKSDIVELSYKLNVVIIYALRTLHSASTDQSATLYVSFHQPFRAFHAMHSGKSAGTFIDSANGSICSTRFNRQIKCATVYPRSFTSSPTIQYNDFDLGIRAPAAIQTTTAVYCIHPVARVYRNRVCAITG